MYNGIAYHQTIYFIADAKRLFRMKEYQWLLCLKRKQVSSEGFSQVLFPNRKIYAPEFLREGLTRLPEWYWAENIWLWLKLTWEKNVFLALFESARFSSESASIVDLCGHMLDHLVGGIEGKLTVPGAGGRSAVTEALGRVWPKPNWPFRNEGGGGWRG